LSGWLHKFLTLATGFYLCLDGGEHALFSRSKSNMNVTPDLGYKCWFPKTSHFPVSNTMTFLKYKHTSASFSLLLLFETHRKENLVAERPSSVFYFDRFFLPDISNLSRWSGPQTFEVGNRQTSEKDIQVFAKEGSGLENISKQEPQ
jgi:hypothetical protein